ncbi:transposase [Streptomyces sp. NBC_00009]
MTAYLRGLMLDGRRKSIQPMAERLPDGNEQNLQQAPPRTEDRCRRATPPDTTNSIVQPHTPYDQALKQSLTDGFRMRFGVVSSR